MKSYLSNRCQRVIIKDAISSVGELKPDVPQGSVLGPLLFLIFINDIADDMLGLGRLFADDTSIGHTAHDETTLKNMINIDLKYIQEWSKRWLVKFNPSKTDIMVFSANNQQNDLTFDFNSTLIQTVNTHKHLGVIFSCPKNPACLLYYMDLYGSIPKIHSVFYINGSVPKIKSVFYTIRIYMDPFQKSSPSFILYGSIRTSSKNPVRI